MLARSLRIPVDRVRRHLAVLEVDGVALANGIDWFARR
jgi:predicted ArsR family transcriptional regulator